MGNASAISTRPNLHDEVTLEALCRKIRTVDAAAARDLPAQILTYLANSLERMDIDIYVEECLPMVCNASHALVRAMGTFSTRYADSGSVESARIRLIQALETVSDEVQACKMRSKARTVAVSMPGPHRFGEMR